VGVVTVLDTKLEIECLNTIFFTCFCVFLLISFTILYTSNVFIRRVELYGLVPDFGYSELLPCGVEQQGCELLLAVG
jgi:hypothetical protein